MIITDKFSNDIYGVFQNTFWIGIINSFDESDDRRLRKRIRKKSFVRYLKKGIVIFEENNFNILKNMSLTKVSCIAQNNNEIFIKNELSYNRLSLQST